MHKSMCKRRNHNALERKTYRSAIKMKKRKGDNLEQTPQYHYEQKDKKMNIVETTILLEVFWHKYNKDTLLKGTLIFKQFAERCSKFLPLKWSSLYI